ncbi:MAG: PKD domain-containing protein, partial [Bacteroidia bacterium]|nr:PKD domain-containing protein [Bacteroidia bacterium]
VYFDITVVGPKPYFNIKDTIGCNSLNAEFVNLSRNCKQYVWSFGDSANSTLQVSDKQTVNFNYTKPGRYYISLVGIDTIFNPFTNRFEYCFNTFPDKVFQKDTHRTVLVLPFVKTGINALDTVCIGTEVLFTSLSDSGYQREYWQLGDTSFIDTLSSPSKVIHRFQNAGQYTIQLNPYYDDPIQDYCRDSSQKTIVVMGVNADFDIDPSSKPPLFIFKNKSNPINSKYNWDFGQSGSSGSNEQDPSYNYGNDTGTYNVCLIATIPFGCADTICKEVVSDYISGFLIGNVFTPGKVDGKNDQFDIIIDGESTYDLYIYNRWGVLVYEGHKDADNSENINWNGRVNNTGEDCPSGTYYYLFNYTLKSDTNTINKVQGTITLIR